jgi:molecular chaperone GrpE
MQASPEHADNTVLEVLQKGFRLHDRLIRPAMVVVSSKA